MSEKQLKNGYTTGACAAAAASAAASLLLGGTEISAVIIDLPRGGRLTIDVVCHQSGKKEATCGVRKDSGDDPDVTNGVMIFARVFQTEEQGVAISGGKGVGRVTRRGLAVPVGKAAINPVPYAMIEAEAKKAMAAAGYGGGLGIEIFIPQGEALAQKTFNPRLGITGGISVLGTTGIVRPMSEDALLQSVRLEINVIKESGADVIALTPGNYGEDFLIHTLGVSCGSVARCSNFLGDALAAAQDKQFSGILLCGHIGKFIKLAGGMSNLHSKYGDCRAELLAAFSAAAGADRDCVKQILCCVTTDEILELLQRQGLLKQTMQIMMDRILFHLSHKTNKETALGVIVYSGDYGVLAQGGRAESLLLRLKKGGNKE